MNNPKFNDYIDVIYLKELDIKDTTDAPKWANYLDLHLEFDEDGNLLTRLYASVMTYSKFLYSECSIFKSNIPESATYGVFCFTVDTLCLGLFEI